MRYVALMNSDRVLQDFRQEDANYVPTEKREILLASRLFVILYTAYLDSNQTLIIKVKSGVSFIESLDDVYLRDVEGKEATIKIYLAGYQDSGPMLRLVTVRESSNLEKYNESLFIPVTHAVYDALSSCRDLIRQGTVYSLKSSGVLTVDDLKLVSSPDNIKPLTAETSNLPSSHRNIIKLRARDLLVSRLNVTLLMDFYQFILLNNRLANNNIHPTPDSIGRLISESQNDVNKGLLLQTRDVMDKMQQYAAVYSLYEQLVKDIQATEDTREMDMAYNKYLRQFQE